MTEVARSRAKFATVPVVGGGGGAVECAASQGAAGGPVMRGEGWRFGGLSRGFGGLFSEICVPLDTFCV